MKQVTRRKFLKNSLATMAGAGVASAIPVHGWSQVAGANDRIRVAIFGVRKKGIEHIKAFGEIDNVELAALVDCDTQFLDLEVAKLKEQKKTVQTFVDFRETLDDKDIDAVVLSVPDHWHAVMTTWACEAGKHVYVEKPATHNIWEGPQMIAAAQKYNRIVGVGSQNRSDVGLLAFANYLKEGNIGKPKFANAISYGIRKSIGNSNGPGRIPPTCNYNLYMGPASLELPTRENLHYDWHWAWSTGTGEMGNLGAHVLDDFRWITGINDLPARVMSLGGRLGYGDDGETPNTQLTFYDYEDIPMIYEIRGLPRTTGGEARGQYRGVRFGMVLQCEGGYFAGGRGGGWVYDNDDKKVKQFPGDGGDSHQKNFIDVIRSGKQEDLRAPLREGHISAGLCHMANISYRLGQTKSAAEIKSDIASNDLVSDSFERLELHLQANEIDLAKTPLTSGPMLSLDIESERFVGEGSSLANLLLKRNYREPFVVPEERARNV